MKPECLRQYMRKQLLLTSALSCSLGQENKRPLIPTVENTDTSLGFRISFSGTQYTHLLYSSTFQTRFKWCNISCLNKILEFMYTQNINDE